MDDPQQGGPQFGAEPVGALDRLNGRISLWLARGAALILATIGLMTFCDVVLRYVFSRPFNFTVEFTEIMMGLMVFLAIGLATHEKRHIGVDAVTMRLSPKSNALIDLIMSIIALAMSCVLVWQLFLKAGVLLQKGDYTQIQKLPYWPGAYIMACGCLFLISGIVFYIVRDIRVLRPGGHGDPDQDNGANDNRSRGTKG
ncbi:MAG: transporter small permease [Rhodospirillales bacterium]|jgi:TRAP-type C4-dicarboxylate transport system permease small subunit|nr:transporter small permease [Rhodospirillales bacterium]